MSISKIIEGLNHPRWLLGTVLLVGLVHGLAYVILVPPWQHYDEPTHFEFAWLIANTARLPETGEYSQTLRREVAASMFENDFFRGTDAHQNLITEEKPIWIGISQITAKPLYYILVSLPLRLVQGSDVTFQLYLGRLVSLLLFLVTLLCAHGVAREITPEGHVLRWMLPLSLALLPGFADIMTSLNDDVGAVAFFSLFLWVGVSLLARGFYWIRFLVLLIVTAACFWLKNTVTVALLLFLIPVLFSLLKNRSLNLAWGTLTFGAAILLPIAFRWGDAAYWYRNSSFEPGTRSIEKGAPLGGNVLRFFLEPQVIVPSVVQLIPKPLTESLQGKQVTLGAWIWASQPITAQTPMLVTGDHNIVEEVHVGLEPRFYALTTKIKRNTTQINVVLSPTANDVEEEVIVYYDGVLLVEGNHSLSSQPEFDGPRGLSGRWGDGQFVNLIRNGSAEAGWPTIQTWLDELLSANYPGQLSLSLAFLLDPRTAFPYYRMAIEKLSESFWAGFGWGHVPLIGSWSYRILKLIALVGLVGAGIVAFRNRKKLPLVFVFFLGVALIAIWGTALLRGADAMIEGASYVPVARYAYPAIIPTLIVLIIGWLGYFQRLEHFIKLPRHTLTILFIGFFISLDILGLLSILRYYGSRLAS